MLPYMFLYPINRRGWVGKARKRVAAVPRVCPRGISRREEVIMREHSLIYTNHRLPTLGRPTSTWRGRPLAEGPRDLYERLTYSLGGGRILLAFYLVSSRQIISEILSSADAMPEGPNPPPKRKGFREPSPAAPADGTGRARREARAPEEGPECAH